MKINLKDTHIYDQMKVGIAVINCKWEYLYMNKIYAKQMEMNCEVKDAPVKFELGQNSTTGIFFNNVCQHVMKIRTPMEIETRYKMNGKLDHWAKISVTPVPEGILIKLKDITVVK